MNLEHQLKHKKIFVVLGMARSGTSAVTRGLKALGIDLGNRLTPPREKWNPKGFWEDNDIVYQINNKIFSTYGMAPYSMCRMDAAQQASDKLHDIRIQAIQLLKSRFELTSHWGFKDPCAAKLLVFWQSIFNEFDIEDQYIIVLRHPLAVAQSYRRVAKADLEEGLLYWLIFMFLAIDGTHQKERMVVSYDLLLKDPRAQLERIKKNLAIQVVTTPADIDEYTNSFLDKTLYHYEAKEDDLSLHPMMSLSPLVLKLYDVLIKLAKDEVTFTDTEFLTTWQSIKNEIEENYPVYNYIDKLINQITQLKTEIRHIHKSKIWLCISPLIKLEKIVRQRILRSLKRKLKGHKHILKSL